MPHVHVEHQRCPFCRDTVQPGHAKAACATCMAWHHHECWQTHGACAACAAERVMHAEDTPPVKREQRPSGPSGTCAWVDCPWDASAKLPEEKVPVGWRSRPLNTLCRGHAAFVLREQGQWTVLLALCFFLPATGTLTVAGVGSPVLPLFVGLTCALVFAAGVRALLRSRRLRTGRPV